MISKIAIKSHLVITLSLLLFIISSCSNDDDSVIDTNAATSAVFYKSSVSLAVGGREKIMLTLEPDDLELNDAEWTSSDTTVAMVDSLGIVTAVTAGDATISLTAGNNISGSCAVEVVESPVSELQMPDARFPIANGVLVILQGEGFTENSEIILRPHTGFKSACDDGDVVAEIHEVT